MKKLLIIILTIGLLFVQAGIAQAQWSSWDSWSLWMTIGDTIYTTIANLSIDLGSGNITTTGDITGEYITIFSLTPKLVFKDSNGVGASSTGFIEWKDSGGGRVGFFGNSSKDDDDLKWKNESNGGHLLLETTGGGNVGIGDTSPLALLTVGNGDLFQVNSSGDITAASSTLSGNLDVTGNITIDSDSSTLRLGDEATDYTIGWNGSDAVHTITAGDFVFTGGNVGIGTAGPVTLLDIDKTTSSATSNRVRIDVDSSTQPALYVQQSGSGDIAQFYKDSNAVIIDNSGNVGINTTPSTGFKLHILMEAADVMGIYVDGDTNPHTGSLSHAFGAERAWDFSTGLISGNMTAAVIEAEHVSSGATVDTARTITTLESSLDMSGGITNTTASELNFFAFPFALYTTNTGSYDSTGDGNMKIQNRGVYVVIDDTSTWDDTYGGNVGGVANTGGYFWVDSNPTLAGGANAVFANFGVRVVVEGTGVGWSVNYGVYIDKVLGADTNWALFDNTTANSCLHALRIGSEVAPTVALDVTGSAIIGVDLDVVGNLTAGTIQADDGWTGTCLAASSTIVVGGIITGCE